MQTYSFLETLLLINGVEMSGFDEGDDVIEVDRFNPSSSHSISADGVMTVSLSADRSGYFRFRLNQTSDSNKYLSGVVAGQENGVFVPIFAQFKDTRGNDLGSGTQGYIAKPAGMTRGTNSNAQEWEVIVERLDLLHLGGE